MNEQNQLPYSNELAKGVADFIGNNDLQRISLNLCKIFFGYLRSQRDGLEVNFDAVLYDVEAIIDFLELAGDEMKHK